MSILAAMLVTQFNSYSSVYLSEGFFLLLKHRKTAKLFQVQLLPKKILNSLCGAAALYNLGIVAI